MIRWLLCSLCLAVSMAAVRGDDWKGLLREGASVKRLASGMRFTEGPVWLKASQRLIFSDIPQSQLMQWQEDKGLTVFRKSENANGNQVDLEGRLLTCQHSGRNIVRTEPDGSLTVVVDRYDGKRLNSPNDLAVKSDGTIWFTDPSYGLGRKPGEIGGKWVYRWEPKSGKLTVVSKRFDMPNGIVFSPDESRLYVSDTGSFGKVLAFPVQNGDTLGEPLHAIDIRSDGMCVDEKGNLYTTASGGVHVFDPAGKRLGVIAVEEQPANVCFGGRAGRTLFITARTSLYAVEMAVRGSFGPGSSGAEG